MRLGRGGHLNLNYTTHTVSNQLHFLSIMFSLRKSQSSISTRENLIKTTKRSMLNN